MKVQERPDPFATALIAAGAARGHAHGSWRSYHSARTIRARRFSDELCRANDSCSHRVVYESKPTIQRSPSHHGIANARIPLAMKAHCDNGM